MNYEISNVDIFFNTPTVRHEFHGNLFWTLYKIRLKWNNVEFFMVFSVTMVVEDKDMAKTVKILLYYDV